MKYHNYLPALFLILSGCKSMKTNEPMTITPSIPKTQAELEIDHLKYLEDVTGEKALQFAKENNNISDQRLKSDPRYQTTYDEIFKIVSAKDKLPNFYIMNGEIYNLWQDDVHVNGIFRKTSINSFNSGLPHWETVLDIDQLASAEGKNWIFKGIQCLEPGYLRCLVSLSDGGKDAVVLREFNLKEKSFAKDGFFIPESKSHATWYDDNTILVGDATNPRTLTSSGYPSQIKILKRGQTLDKAQVMFNCQPGSMSAYVYSTMIDGARYTTVGDQISFYESETFFVDFENNKLNRLPIPKSANFETIFKGQVIFSTRDGLDQFRAGSVLSFPLSELTRYKVNITSVFKPTSQKVFEALSISKNHLYVQVLDDVKSKIIKMSFDKGSWQSEPVKTGNPIGNESLSALHRDSGQVYINYYDFLTPPSIYTFDDSAKETPKRILESPHRFNSANLRISQYKVKSKDGTLIPYFVVGPKDMKFNGKNPTLLYGYGGFEIPMVASYSGSIGKAWLEKGGVYVLANIRGGGEYGPDWHQSVLRENRHKIYEDFYAIAEDLISKKITSPEHLGIRGGSNGGLLTSVALTQRPELFKAVISEVPLTNLMEYHHWLAGASWMQEYGNPDDPEMRKYLLSYSPVHNLKKGKNYPEAFYLTSTKDDRVHPAHARQMVARLKELGYPVLYNENTEGGHGRASNMRETAEYLALEFTYLYQKLM
jgi:prolyl oligopeptidase